jgi:hypothetical protein
VKERVHLGASGGVEAPTCRTGNARGTTDSMNSGMLKSVACPHAFSIATLLVRDGVLNAATA